MRPILPALLLALLLPVAPARSTELHCLGTERFFILLLDGDVARFDYLGDGVFPLTPALPDTLPDFLRLSLGAYAGPIPVFLERGACPITARGLPLSLPWRVELGIETLGVQQPMTGCCREAGENR
ncbi:hypothetical protein roselon_02904 [Roseibacterium elongatum DSM 19469]|uniref:Uncharacterized protein n=1 Tax=Roseicyclus elongatus DSM 19469 TaxID=1294273 RepID=W8S4P6_9RHOB|nr:hypothetical protein [Roseibacterium elongatum]AHM05192.1 hypothetical protein roselon_02904 [Roseibacterium elongatum DSM 19469]